LASVPPILSGKGERMPDLATGEIAGCDAGSWDPRRAEGNNFDFLRFFLAGSTPPKRGERVAGETGFWVGR
jgi:hypothetical protein